jgi:hypothetical protein
MRVLGVFALSLCLAGTAAAPNGQFADVLESRVGMVGASAKPGFAGGKLNSCAVEFTFLARDWAYRQGGFIIVNGTYGFMAAKGALAVVLKVVVHDIDDRTMSRTPTAPTSAYLLAQDKLSNNVNELVSGTPSDTPGGYFAIFKPEKSVEIVLEEKVVVAFARKKGGSDILIEIDTTVADVDANGRVKRSPQTQIDFANCASRLANSLK